MISEDDIRAAFQFGGEYPGSFPTQGDEVVLVPKTMTLDEVISADAIYNWRHWIETSGITRGELRNKKKLSQAEKLLDKDRGEGWTKGMVEKMRKGMRKPLVFLAGLDEGEFTGKMGMCDGRGRFIIALGLNLSSIPVVVVKKKTRPVKYKGATYRLATRMIPKSEWKASEEAIKKKAEEFAEKTVAEMKKGTKAFRVFYSTRGVTANGDSHHNGSRPFRERLKELGVKMTSPVPNGSYNLASFVAEYKGKTWWVSADQGRLAAGYGGRPGMGYPVTYAHTYKFKLREVST